MEYNVVIIGCGPAAMLHALYLKKYGIENICIIPEYQRKGIGTKILKDIIEKYNETNIEIQYFKQNPVGNLYERLGFEKYGENNFHYKMIKHWSSQKGQKPQKETSPMGIRRKKWVYV